MDWDSETESKALQRLLHIMIRLTFEPVLASHKSKIFLAMRGLLTPFKPLRSRGHIPVLAHPWCTYFIGGGAKNVFNILNNISQNEEQVFGAKIGHFNIIFNNWGLKKGGGAEKLKAVKTGLFEVKGN
jgi:hypothetical protein